MGPVDTSRTYWKKIICKVLFNKEKALKSKFPRENKRLSYWCLLISISTLPPMLPLYILTSLRVHFWVYLNTLSTKLRLSALKSSILIHNHRILHSPSSMTLCFCFSPLRSWNFLFFWSEKELDLNAVRKCVFSKFLVLLMFLLPHF